MSPLTPTQWNEKACEGRDEERRANPIERLELLEDPSNFVVKTQEYRDANECQDAERYVDPKNPSPCRLLSEDAANNWSSCRTDGPLNADETKPFAPFTQSYHIRHDHVCKSHNSPTTDSLNATTSDHDCEIICDGGSNRSNEKKSDCNEEDRLATYNV